MPSYGSETTFTLLPDIYSTSLCDAVAISVGHRTCDSRVEGSSPGWATPRSGLQQAT